MDAGFLNFHGGEQFSTFDSSYFLDPSGEESQSYEGTTSWDWDRERELNGDIGLIPIANNTDGDFCFLSTSPSSEEDFHKIMYDWQELVNIEAEDVDDLVVDVLKEESEDDKSNVQFTTDDKTKLFSAATSLACAVDLKEEPRSSTSSVKYSCNTNKQRKASVGGKKIDMKNQRYVLDSSSSEDDDDDEEDHVDVETLSDVSLNNKDVKDDELDAKVTLPEIKQLPVPKENLCLPKSENKLKIETSTNTETVDTAIVSPVIQAVDLNSLLEQFEATESKVQNVPKTKVTIEKKVQSNLTGNKKDVLKTKLILDALPQELIKRIRQQSCKRKSNSLTPTLPPNKKPGKIVSDVIFLDHNYSASSTSSKKDSGFTSCEEDDKSVICNQPTVKTADGKLMVSLLKVNTIKKRKLNLEEYKRLRKGRSYNGSPSPCEDENARRLKRMSVQPIPPANFEMKTLVSIGVNTDQSWAHLQEMMQGCQANFSINSFITSLVEHIPQGKHEAAPVEQAEDKTIVYLDKNRLPIKTADKYTQTSSHRRNSCSSLSCSSRSSRSASRSPPRGRRNSSERVREVEERRVIYVGRIGDLMTRDELRRRFQHFGPITNVSVHFRQSGDNYGFVTFKYREDAYEAVEHGNDDVSLPRYDLSFGGRRMFCQTSYSDLDNVHDKELYSLSQGNDDEGTFDLLLREARAKLNKRMF